MFRCTPSFTVIWTKMKRIVSRKENCTIVATLCGRMKEVVAWNVQAVLKKLLIIGGGLTAGHLANAGHTHV